VMLSTKELAKRAISNMTCTHTHNSSSIVSTAAHL